MSAFIKKIDKIFCRNDANYIKSFVPEQIVKLAEYYCNLVNCFNFGTFPECVKVSFVRPIVKKYSDPDILKSYWLLYNTSFQILIQSNGVCLPTAVAEAFEQF